jgi:molybdenum cofactor synthesis domain-containing protein
VYEDKSGPAVEEVVSAGIPGVEIERAIVPDEPKRIEAALRKHLRADVIITTGGTGIGTRDVTPDVTERFCDRLVPGIAEILRVESYRQTPHAMLSRAVAGVKATTLIVNLPGSVRGAQFCAELLIPALKHAPDMLRGEGH